MSLKGGTNLTAPLLILTLQTLSMSIDEPIPVPLDQMPRKFASLVSNPPPCNELGKPPTPAWPHVEPLGLVRAAAPRLA